MEEINELVKMCMENKAYEGLIIVKNESDKKYFIDKFKNLDCEFFNYYWKTNFEFKNNSIVYLLCEQEIKSYVGYKNCFSIIDNRIDKYYIKNIIRPSLVHYGRDGKYIKSIIKYIDLDLEE